MVGRRAGRRRLWRLAKRRSLRVHAEMSTNARRAGSDELRTGACRAESRSGGARRAEVAQRGLREAGGAAAGQARARSWADVVSVWRDRRLLRSRHRPERERADVARRGRQQPAHDLPEYYLDKWGDDIEKEDYEFYATLPVGNHVCFLVDPVVP